MKAILMAGGKGTRLRPVCDAMPKPMTELLGKPLLERLTQLLARSGFDDLCVTLGYMPKCITDYFGDGSAFGVSMCYRVEKTPLGTAGGVRSCMDFIGNEDFLVISGDAACDFDLADLAREHKNRGGAVTMALCPNSEPLPYGTVLTDRAGRVVNFIEKPSWERVVTDLVNTGVYMVSPRAMELFPENVPFDFARDLFPLMQEKELPIVGVPMDGYWCDIGSPRSYLRCCLDALDGKLHIEGEDMPGIRAPADLPEDVQLIAPCYICDGAVIERGATIGRSVIHAGSRIGAYSRVVNSVVDGGNVGEACVLNGTVVCRGAVLGPDTVTTRGDVVSANGEYGCPSSEPVRPPRRRSLGLVREIACGDRARLMREMSTVLWEAGADFSDGITLSDGACMVRISPLAEESAITVEAVGGREKERLEMCRKYSELAEKFGGKGLTL
ncbi:MAG: sugar phosphate nucleotidyltransferase [Oscillospiraceae bacterium]|jgi:mannose-1-phosphate guanylyltransferase/phosphomannomutase